MLCGDKERGDCHMDCPACFFSEKAPQNRIPAVLFICHFICISVKVTAAYMTDTCVSNNDKYLGFFTVHCLRGYLIFKGSSYQPP